MDWGGCCCPRLEVPKLGRRRATRAKVAQEVPASERSEWVGGCQGGVETEVDVSLHPFFPWSWPWPPSHTYTHTHTQRLIPHSTTTTTPLQRASRRPPPTALPETQRTMRDANPGWGKFGQAPFQHASATEATHVHPCSPHPLASTVLPRPCPSSDPPPCAWQQNRIAGDLTGRLRSGMKCTKRQNWSGALSLAG